MKPIAALFLVGAALMLATNVNRSLAASPANATPRDLCATVINPSSEIAAVRGPDIPVSNVAPLVDPRMATIHSLFPFTIELRTKGQPPLPLLTCLRVEAGPGGFDVLDILVSGRTILFATCENGFVCLYRLDPLGKLEDTVLPGHSWSERAAITALDHHAVSLKLTALPDQRISFLITDLRPHGGATTFVQDQTKWAFVKAQPEAAATNTTP
jgi:hypothetical protein